MCDIVRYYNFFCSLHRVIKLIVIIQTHCFMTNILYLYVTTVFHGKKSIKINIYDIYLL